MREIKFRVWTTTEMQEVYNTEYKNGVLYANNYPINDVTFYKLMQYTGLKDKNGKEIYEGDIIETKNWGNYRILWQDGHSGFRKMGTKSVSSSSFTHSIALSSLVIGNIYQNPELLANNN